MELLLGILGVLVLGGVFWAFARVLRARQDDDSKYGGSSGGYRASGWLP